MSDKMSPRGLPASSITAGVPARTHEHHERASIVNGRQEQLIVAEVGLYHAMFNTELTVGDAGPVALLLVKRAKINNSLSFVDKQCEATRRNYIDTVTIDDLST